MRSLPFVTIIQKIMENKENTEKRRARATARRRERMASDPEYAARRRTEESTRAKNRRENPEKRAKDIERNRLNRAKKRDEEIRKIREGLI